MLLIYLRVEVVLDDPSRIVPHYIDKWAMFLPSDLSLDCINVQFSFLHMMLWVHLHVLFLCVCVCMHACVSIVHSLLGLRQSTNMIGICSKEGSLGLMEFLGCR